MNEKLLEACEKRIGYNFKDDFWLKKALTHSSNKNNGFPCNERLEFLGDSVLGMVVSEHLFSNFKDHSEGDLTKIKSLVVSRVALARRSKELGLENFISIGKGMRSPEVLPVSVMANVMEAIIGAIFMDGGIDHAREFIITVLSAELEEAVANHGRVNFKSLLQQFAQREFASTPTYRVIGNSGPDHEKTFHVVAVIDDQCFETAWGRSKKEAEQRAAELTYSTFLQSDVFAPPEQGQF